MAQKKMVRKHRIQVSIEKEIKEIFNLVEKISGDRTAPGRLCYGLLKEKLYYFLDETDCDLSFIDREIKHLLKRTECGIYTKQFKQTIMINKLKGGQNKNE